jgi:ribose/xylose/arabinose/galactoside ABC-type transport system permease subunit
MTSEATTSPAPSRWTKWLNSPILNFALVLAVLCLLIYWREGERRLLRFLALPNLQIIAQSVAVTGVVALGALLIILTGGIDLSVGSVAALTGVNAMLVYRYFYPADPSGVLPLLAALGVGLLTGALAGLTNGLIITWLKVTPFITTLGMMGIARSLAYHLSGKVSLGFPGDKPTWLRLLYQPESPVLFSLSFWSFLVLAGLLALLLRYHILGRWCYAIGSNEATARVCGVPIERARLLLYALAGVLTAWGGLLAFAELGGEPSSHPDLALDVIAVVVIGGASLNGGRGTVGGTLLGVLIVGVLNNGVSFLGVPVEVRFLLVGLVIIASAAVSRWQGR